MHSIRKRFVALSMSMALGGTCLQLSACDAVGLARDAITSINPCGTILACDPAEYEFANSGIDGPGVRPDIDPFCTYPPYCGPDVDPIFGFGGGG